MNSSTIALLLMAFVLLLAVALAIHNQNRERKRRFLQQAKEHWGTQTPLSMSAEAFESIKVFSDVKPHRDAAARIDDVTWTDCDFDRIYRASDHCLSSPGDDVLYFWYRYPLTDETALQKRSHLITWMQTHEDERLRLMEVLFSIGRSPKTSYFAASETLKHTKRIGRGKYLFFGLLTLFLLVLLLFHPVLAVCLMVPDFLVNIALQMGQQRRIYDSIRAISAIRHLLDGGRRLASLQISELSETNQRLLDICEHLKVFRKHSQFVTAKSTVSGSLFDVLLQYLNLFFHLDLIQFDRIIEHYEGHEDEIYQLTELIGTVDAAISAASFRDSLPYWCPHTTLPFENETKPPVSTEGLYHPLLSNAVPNRISTDGGNLITGANASGKSTFLKSMTIAMILGQSLDTIPAHTFRAPFFRIYTSMALTDNLSGGESYFIVEIRSLKRIMDAAKTGEVPVFAVIDEVLRGTNTIERIAASAHLLSACEQQPMLLFAATHDIELTKLLAPAFHNYHFSGVVREKDVHFDYTIKDGPTTERNAIQLLKTAGYDEALADRAEQSAQQFETTGEWKL